MTGQARKERQALRRIQAQKVMPLIGPLLDAYEAIPFKNRAGSGLPTGVKHDRT